MPKGVRIGGRKKGTPNKRSLMVAEKLAEWGCDPIRGLVELARDKSIDAQVRVRAYSELASYCYSKPRTEVGQQGPATLISIGLTVPPRTIDAEPTNQLIEVSAGAEA